MIQLKSGCFICMATLVLWVNAQTTEQVRLYGTFNVNRNNPYQTDNSRYGTYAGAYSNSNFNSSQNKDALYWDRTRDQLRSQYGINTDRYSPNWGSNDRVDSRYDSRNPTSSRFPGSDPLGASYYDGRNQNYDSKDLFDSKVPSFESGSRATSIYDRDRGSQINWDREKERERERERERQRELERERSFYLNNRNRGTLNANNPNYGSNIPRTKLPGEYHTPYIISSM